MAPLVTLITGCSSGIGMETALRLAREAGKPFIVYATMRNLGKRGEIEKQAGDCLNDTLFTHQLDVTKEDTIVDAVSHILSSHGRIDVLVNNAGLAAQSVLEVTSLDTFRQMFEPNFFGVVRVTQEVLPIMKKQRSGRIVNVSSTMGIVGLPFYEMYASSKFAVEGLSECMAMQLRHFNIWVSTVQPGPVKTNILENIAANNLPTAQQDDPTLDPDTKKLFASAQKNRADRFVDAQPVEEVVDVIHKVILAPKPHLRNPTNVFTEAASRVKYTDTVGDAWVDEFYDKSAKF